jgi:DNA mismatch repair ATPase MutS
VRRAVLTRADTYIARLVRKGFRVRSATQVEDRGRAKGIVKREVVRGRVAWHLHRQQLTPRRARAAFLMAVWRDSKRPAPAGRGGCSMSRRVNSRRPNTPAWMDSRPCADELMVLGRAK